MTYSLRRAILRCAAKKPSAIETERLQTAVKEKQRFYREKMIAGVNFDKIYNDFE